MGIDKAEGGSSEQRGDEGTPRRGKRGLETYPVGVRLTLSSLSCRLL